MMMMYQIRNSSKALITHVNKMPSLQMGENGVPGWVSTESFKSVSTESLNSEHVYLKAVIVKNVFEILKIIVFEPFKASKGVS